MKNKIEVAKVYKNKVATFDANEQFCVKANGRTYCLSLDAVAKMLNSGISGIEVTAR